ncbi:hypothetical protein M3B43_10105 [Nesterenkonia massiliensis]|uniref:DUF5666 domain-containing protein n=1 Tax=Nesterenkonia massiliensis TaxID=1232429 RepID=A0ABT2HSJ6_9MICC|nr:hypothetical protein [Nesterenkonia massiliensis]MCT1607663.1 hypothetical protein [Nesterenkonia massiliensis]
MRAKAHLLGMSPDNTRHPSRRAKKTKSSDQEPDVPAVLPHVIITVTEPTGALAVTVDGEDFPAPEDGAWSRARFGEVLDAVTEDRTRTVRIEVHETDGSTFTDIIRARRRTLTDTEAEQPQAARSKPSGKAAAATVSGEGFVPGEDVAIAAVVTDTTADEDGEVEVRLTRRQKANLRAGAEVLVFGRSSGTTLVRRLP